MKVIRKGKNVVKFYDSPDEIPAKRWQRFNKYMMIANDVGDSMNDYNIRTGKVISFLEKGLLKEALEELRNRQMTVYNSLTEYSPRGRALAVMVKSINGEAVEGFSDSELDEVLTIIDDIGISKKEIDNIIFEVKKK